MRKYIILSIIIAGFFVLAAESFSAGEDITITTYYPSPHGVFMSLRLYPNADPVDCTAETAGTMYYGHTSHTGWLCRETFAGVYDWVDFARYD